MSTPIDLRSDTVTLPPPEMRRAMTEAALGDDVYGEDPTVNALQERAAALVGMEAALFVPSGTMGNLVAVLTHCGRGDEIILGDQSHMFYYEGGGASVLGAAAMHTLPTGADGTLDPAAIEVAVRPANDAHFPSTTLICLENTHNRRGGMVLPPSYIAAVRAVADKHGLMLHLDGARVCNAAVAHGVSVAQAAGPVDTISLCLSKGLAAPVGTVLCGSRDFIKKAHHWRKVVGGGMRQAGVVAAAGLYALDHMIDRLQEDHDNARHLAEGLCAIKGVMLRQRAVETNIVFVDMAGTGIVPQRLSSTLKDAGVLAGATGSVVRFVTHYGIEHADVEEALSRVARAVRTA